MKKINIVKEFTKAGFEALKLQNTGFYDAGTLILGLLHMLAQNNFFYGKLTAKHPSKDPNKVSYNLSNEPKVHQLVYVQLGAGYPTELRGPHWCYVYRKAGPKLIVFPVTSIKENSRPVKPEYEIEIMENNGTVARMHMDEILRIDKMRIVESRKYIDIDTSYWKIRKAVKKFMK